MFNILGKSTTIALLLSPVGLLLIAATRLLIVSNYNPTIASAVVSSGGYVNTLLGSVLPLVSLIMPYIAVLLLFFSRVIASLLAFLATALISPLSINRQAARILVKKDLHLILMGISANTLIMILLALYFILLLFGLAQLSFTVFVKSISTVASLVLIPFIWHLYPVPLNSDYYKNLIRQPWLPAENITLTSHQNIVGYALSSQGAWFVVLMAYSRTITYYPANDIAKQEVCQMGQQGEMRPIIILVPAAAPVPQCGQSGLASSGGRLSLKPSWWPGDFCSPPARQIRCPQLQ